MVHFIFFPALMEMRIPTWHKEAIEKGIDYVV
jgi:hypothetical protein